MKIKYIREYYEDEEDDIGVYLIHLMDLDNSWHMTSYVEEHLEDCQLGGAYVNPLLVVLKTLRWYYGGHEFKYSKKTNTEYHYCGMCEENHEYVTIDLNIEYKDKKLKTQICYDDHFGSTSKNESDEKICETLKELGIEVEFVDK